MKPLVSICCLTYNHEKYIVDALESFLAQECEFPYEIIVHDDASTDCTAEIVREYERKYPDIIMGIYQKANQFSQGIGIRQTFVAPLVRGEYVATCEGDDYWCDPLKLKKQVEFLESNKDYSMCFHTVSIVDTSKKYLGGRFGVPGYVNKDISISESAQGGVVHVSSRVVRKNYYVQPRPAWVANARWGDCANALYYRAEGKVYFMAETMSCYRAGVADSLMTKFRENYSKEDDISNKRNRIKTLDLANKYYDYAFDSEIKKNILITSTEVLLLERRVNKDARKVYRRYYKEFGFKKTIKTITLAVFPKIARILARVTRSFRKIGLPI